MRNALNWLILLLAVQGLAQKGPDYVSDPVVPTLTPAVRDLPDFVPDPNYYNLEAKRRDPMGLIGPGIDMPPHDNPLVEIQSNAPPPQPNAFPTPVVNFAGVTSSSSPPDDTGDIGLTYFLQGDNGPGGSRVTIYNKTGAQQQQFLMETLGSSPCNNGYCDPIIQYDELADRWMISEFDTSGNTLCVYVSRTGDARGQWWAYSFNPSSSGMQDYPKYAVWPDGYYIAANNGGWVIVLERSAMLNGTAARMLEFNIGTLSGFGFQLTMPGTLEGPAPPAGSPALFLRPRDTEIHGGTCTGCDLMEMWALHVDWVTTSNSTLTALTGVQMTDWDHTLCGTGSTWNCMPQPGTAQKIDPIREPIHYPLQYRNFGTHETLVGCFAQDVDGTDHAAVHWFEIRRTPPGTGSWVRRQDGVLGGEANVHRSVCSAAMDSAGDIAVFYTRTGTASPYYPSIYYSGRLSTDPLGTMPYYDNRIQDATTSKTNNERWGDYAGVGVDPSDNCTFWFTTEYGGSGQTRVSAAKFDQCGTCTAPGAPTLTAATGTCSGVTLTWSAGSGTTNAYNVYRAAACGGSYTKIAGPLTGTTTYADTTGVAGTSYGYMVRGTCDAGGTTESANSNCLSAIRLVAPTPTITGASANTCPSVTVPLTTESGQSTYQWFRNGSPVGTNSNAYTATQSGDYTVSYTAANGCSGTSAAKTVTITPCAPVIVYQSNTTPLEIDGDMDGVMEAGEKWRMTVTVTNSGNMPATAVLGSLSGEGLTVCNNPGAFGGVGVGATANYTFDFIPSTASWYGTYPCGSSIGFDLVSKSSDGGAYPYGDDANFATRQVGTAGGTVVLFGPDDMANANNWTTVGTISTNTAVHCSPADDTYLRLSGNPASITLATPVSTVGLTNIHLRYAYAEGNTNGSTFTVGWSTDGTTWNSQTLTNTTTWQCDQDWPLPAGAENQATLYVRFAWNNTTANRRGWVDYVSITSTGGITNCDTWTASCAAANPKEASPAGFPMTASKGAGNSVAVTYTAGCGGTSHAVYWRKLAGPITGPLTWTNAACGVAIDGTFDPGAFAPGEWAYFVVTAQTSTKEGSYGLGTSGERPEATGIGACDRPQDLSGICP